VYVHERQERFEHQAAHVVEIHVYAGATKAAHLVPPVRVVVVDGAVES